ncbi:uncharacterized protein LOC144885065 isoform X2 [Branchiostoma floridae x Branchiostoma japonicum]
MGSQNNSVVVYFLFAGNGTRNKTQDFRQGPVLHFFSCRLAVPAPECKRDIQATEILQKNMVSRDELHLFNRTLREVPTNITITVKGRGKH